MVGTNEHLLSTQYPLTLAYVPGIDNDKLEYKLGQKNYLADFPNGLKLSIKLGWSRNASYNWSLKTTTNFKNRLETDLLVWYFVCVHPPIVIKPSKKLWHKTTFPLNVSWLSALKLVQWI